MNAEPELSIDAIIDELIALSAERERECEAIRTYQVDSRIPWTVTKGMAAGIREANHHIESMRRKAANARYDAMYDPLGRGQRDSDV